MAMNKRDKALWVKELRSGEYKQGTGCLCKVVDGEERFCCLGVAADIFVDGEWDLDTFNGAYSILGNGWRYVPPGVERVATLMGMNDNGYTFDEIADWIEENL